MRCYCPRLQDTCGVAGEWSEEGLEGGSVAVGASGEVWRCEEVMGVAPVVVMCVARGWEGWRMCVRRSVRTVEPLLAAEENLFPSVFNCILSAIIPLMQHNSAIGCAIE